MSEYQQDGNIQEGKVSYKFDGDLRYLELGKAIKADLVEGHIYSMIEESDSFRKKLCPPSFTPPPSPPPRPAKTQQRKQTTKTEVSEQHSPEKLSIKRSDEGNIDETKLDLTQQNAIVPDQEKYEAVTKPVKGKKKDTTTYKRNKNLTNVLSSPSINDNFERKCRIQNSVKEEEKTETCTKKKDLDYVGSLKDDTELMSSIYYLPMSPINKDIANDVGTFARSGGKEADIKCNDHLKLDSGKAEKEIDDNEYEIVRNAGTDIMDVISPTWIRRGKTIPFRSLSKRELVKYLEKCGLHNLAAVCEKEKLDGYFLEKYVNDEDLMLEPFFLTLFQIKKLRAIINGWRPISEFPINIDGVSD
ncbi:hypothetical protein CHS0354_042177 [Potamilus streckersoni]|uniref:SAM domain-containing protein n=1 Tax=Potamilus streckersoni TaxID=2493646 RepID=A0AAE0TP30_9BIVA|nr:hypothetical protein CHS0354_042177 [Potamilus streckersoni]